MDRRRQSILKQDGRMPLQETVIPDFPEEDTATVTVTKSRRVSFGANFVKEFIVGSAVSTQFFSEYEQAVSSSDSSNPNSSRSGILDRTTFHEEDALNLCVKPTNQDEFEPLKKKYCFEKSNCYSELNDKNNENIWDFNVNSGSNIFAEKNLSYSNKPELSRNNIRCNKNVNSLNESLMNDKQFQNKRNDSELNSSKLNETLEKKSKVGKFSSTIFFSADSPTADVEFTEGCISLAKSIFDKKKKDMTVYIKGTPKESNKDEERDGSNTIVFDSEDSNVGMKLTKCIDETESESDMSTGNFSNYFPVPKGNDPHEEFDESHENIENVPIHMYSMNMMLSHGDNSEADAELEKSLFFPERSLTEMLQSDSLKTTMTDFSSIDKDNTEECDMEISSSDLLKTSIVEENRANEKESNSIIDPVTTTSFSESHAIDEDEDCTSPVFSRVTVGNDLSLMSEDGESDLSVLDPLRTSMCCDLSLSGNEDSKMELSNSNILKLTNFASGSETEEPVIREQCIMPSANGDIPTESENCRKKEDSKLEFDNSSHKKLVNNIFDSETEKASLNDGINIPNNEIQERFNSGSNSSPMTLTNKITNPVTEEALLGDEINDQNNELEKRFSSGSNSSLMKPINYIPDPVTEEALSLDKMNTSNNKAQERFSSGSNSSPMKPTNYIPDSVTEEALSLDKMNTSNNKVQERFISGSNSSPMKPTNYIPDSVTEEALSLDKMNTSNNKVQERFISGSNSSPIKLTNYTGDHVTEEVSLRNQMNTSNNKVQENPDNRCPLLEHDNQKKTNLLESDNCPSKMDVSVSQEREESSDSPSIVDRSGVELETLQETQFCESSFMSDSNFGESDGTSLGDKKILGLLTEQSEESNCCWKIDSIHSLDNFWIFSFPILKSSAVMKFKLMPPKDKSLVSFSLILDSSLELKEPNEYQLQKDRIAIDFVFGKLKNNFHREIHGLENVHKMPLFLDKMNLIMKKMNGILNQVIRILKNYPGSNLKKSVLSFRIYSLPLLFSYLVSIDLTDPLQLSENSISVKKHFGTLKIGLVKSIFSDCLGKDEFLINFIRTLTNSVVEMEREIGSITKRAHIRLIT